MVEQNKIIAPIMIVDDHRENIFSVETILMQEDRSFVRAGSGEECLKLALDNDFALILLDVQMPGMDGFETAEFLRKNKHTSHIPIVFITAINVEEHNVFKGYRSGAVDFIYKPVNTQILCSKVDVFCRLYRQKEQIRLQSNVDELTGLCSRRYGLELIELELARFRRDGIPVSFLLADIDDFKRINDTYGHSIGDIALIETAKAIKYVLRDSDIAIRYGGDEFLLILNNCDMGGAEKICRRLNEYGIICDCNDGKKEKISLSIGGTVIKDNSTNRKLIEEADIAMLVAKSRGKGQWNLLKENDNVDHEVLRELKTTRNSIRDILCKALGKVLSQLEREDDMMNNRSELMQVLAEQFANTLSLIDAQKRTLKNAVMLAEFDKTGLSHEIASKDKTLTAEQQKVLLAIMDENIKILEQTGILDEEIMVLKSRHEWFDGSGIPAKLSGEEIPLLSRITGLIAAYTLLVSGGVHTKVHSHAEALKKIYDESNTHFDPVLVNHLNNIITNYHSDEHAVNTGDILLIEDYEKIAKIMSIRLKAAGYNSTVVSTLEDARQKLKGMTPYAVLTDLMLPDGSGLDFIEEMRSGLVAKNTPIAVISSRFDKEAVNTAKENGAFAYIAKPIKFEQLLKALKNCQQITDSGEFRKIGDSFN